MPASMLRGGRSLLRCLRSPMVISMARASMVTKFGCGRRALSTGTPPRSHDQPTSEPQVAHAVVSVFDMFSIGVGPSSSHTVGPMRAAKIFVEDLAKLDLLEQTESVRVDLYGSLALTGDGHGTPGAVLMGLEGESPETVDAKGIPARLKAIKDTQKLKLRNEKTVDFSYSRELVFHKKESLPQHPNGLRITCFDANGDMVATNEFFSIGGGFVVNEHIQTASTARKRFDPNVPAPHPLDENVYYKDDRVDHTTPVNLTNLSPSNVHLSAATPNDPPVETHGRIDQMTISAALPFHDAASLLNVCEQQGLSIAQVVFRNEMQWRSADEIKRRTLNIWNVMDGSIRAGCNATDEYLPGALKVRRRAPALQRRLLEGFREYAGVGDRMRGVSAAAAAGAAVVDEAGRSEGVEGGVVRAAERSIGFTRGGTARRVKRSLPALDWISVYALAVNEENAAGGRVVTAPTNGAAGTIPAVLKYYLEFICNPNDPVEQDIVEFLLTAAAIGMLYKRGASISAAEMGCQGEVGVACSMAAAAFTAVMGGTVEQVENAAEIGMEHNLGLTCDPPMGLVVIPCIERNALAAVKAVTAAQLALNGDGKHRVSLDNVIATMRQTGNDMMNKYKETSEGGLAVNVPVC